MVARVAQVEAVGCDSAHEAAWLERNLLRAQLPPWNRSPSGGQEEEVWIRLSESAGTPGLQVVHRPSPQARQFGPYLGGLQVRRAVSGLSRVLPLDYAGGGQSGTRHEMARALGVTAAERDRLAETVAAVLDRDPAAVALARERLSARRDEAAAALAFEFAARLQQEIEALAWVTAEQKVTRSAPDDLDVCGWADGTLVRFAIRCGRLSGWSRAAATPRRPAATGPPRRPSGPDSPSATPSSRPGWPPTAAAPAPRVSRSHSIRMNARVVPAAAQWQRSGTQRSSRWLSGAGQLT